MTTINYCKKLGTEVHTISGSKTAAEGSGTGAGQVGSVWVLGWEASPRMPRLEVGGSGEGVLRCLRPRCRWPQAGQRHCRMRQAGESAPSEGLASSRGAYPYFSLTCVSFQIFRSLEWGSDSLCRCWRQWTDVLSVASSYCDVQHTWQYMNELLHAPILKPQISPNPVHTVSLHGLPHCRF